MAWRHKNRGIPLWYFKIVYYFPDIFALIYLLLNSSTSTYLIPCTYLAWDEILWPQSPALVSWNALCVDNTLHFTVNFALHRKHIPSPLQRPFTESVCYTYFCYDFNRNRCVSTNFSKTTEKEMLRTLLRRETRCFIRKDGRMDGRAVMMWLVVALRKATASESRNK
jgi:hypothetical protein